MYLVFYSCESAAVCAYILMLLLLLLLLFVIVHLQPATRGVFINSTAAHTVNQYRDNILGDSPRASVGF